MVPLVTIAAFAIDAGWWQVGANQLQTSADAAALAGARALQLNPTTNTQATVYSYANQVVGNNKAFGQTLTLATTDVEAMFWTPATATTAASLVGATGWSTANAVRVTTRATPGLVLAGVVRATGPTITRQGTAWIANIQSGNCIKPWALPYTVFYDAVVAATGLTSNIPPSAPSTNPPFRNNLTQAQIAALNQLASTNQMAAQRTIILRGPTVENVNFPTTATPVASLPAVNLWYGYNYVGNAGGTSYQYQIGNCGPGGTPVTVGTGANEGTTLPGQNDLECYTIRALQRNNGNTCGNGNGANSYSYLSDYGCSGTQNCPPEQTCAFRPLPNPVTEVDAGCYPPAQYMTGNTVGTIPVNAVPGVDVWVVWGDGTGNGSNLTSYRQVGRFRVLCIFRTYIKGSSTNPRESALPGSPPERCAVPNGLTYENLPAGTLVGIVGQIRQATLGPGVELGNTVSMEQRLILVR